MSVTVLTVFVMMFWIIIASAVTGWGVGQQPQRGTGHIDRRVFLDQHGQQCSGCGEPAVSPGDAVKQSQKQRGA